MELASLGNSLEYPYLSESERANSSGIEKLKEGHYNIGQSSWLHGLWIPAGQVATAVARF